MEGGFGIVSRLTAGNAKDGLDSDLLEMEKEVLADEDLRHCDGSG